MAMVAFDDRSFTIDGRRVWLVSGAVHYFRIPSALWRDRLTKARRGGLNCIETYAAWNVHEPTEGEWNFSGDNDIAEFIKQAGDLGLYVIVRPGPYIGAAWDFGGFPAWLLSKSGLQLRGPGAVYTHYYDKYLRQLLPRLVDLQVSRGGNIIAIQCENEYSNTTMPDRMEYLEYISRHFARARFDIPVLTCNLLSEPMPAGAVECITCWDRGVEDAKRLRHVQPDKPLFAIECRTGAHVSWGRPHAAEDPREVTRRALELVGCGAQINHYMFCGGTNFGFGGGRGIRDDCDFVATSYDCDAPVAEGGGLTRKYYLLRLVNLMNRHLGGVLAEAAPMYAPAVLNGVTCHCRSGPAGTIVVVSNGGDERITSAKVAMPDGLVLEVDLTHFGAVALMHNAAVTPKYTLEYSNLTPLGVFGGNALLLHGTEGQAGVLSIDGQAAAVTVPANDEIETLEYAGLAVYIMRSSLAERCWDVDGQLVIGPTFVGETLDEIIHDRAATQYWTLCAEGKLTAHNVRAAKAKRSLRPPTLGPWKLLTTCGEPLAPDETMTRLDRVKPFSKLGVSGGYGWYRVGIELPRAATKGLFLPGCADRATVFANEKRVGVWGRGQGAKREPIRAQLRRGVNQLTFLVDNLGRFSVGDDLGELKGMWDDVYAAAPVRMRSWRVKDGVERDLSRRAVPRQLQYVMDGLRGNPLVAETTFTLGRPLPVHMQFAGLSEVSAMIVLCNDRPIGFFANSGGFGEILARREVVKGTNRLKLFVWTEVTTKQLAAAFRLHRLEENLSAGCRWRFTPWTVPSEAGEVKTKGYPAWYSASFKRPSSDEPLFVRLGGASKGQLFLNGRNIGRHWSIGPQEAYYLPECWLEQANELMVFDEEGKEPTGAKLEFLPKGPYG